MSELLAQNSNVNNDKNNINNNSTIIENEKKELKRRSKMNCDTMSKQARSNNYYGILDNDKDCNQEFLKKFEKHVQDHEIASTSRNSLPNIPTNKENNNDTNNENVPNNNQNKNKKIPPLNIYEVEPNELIEFIKNGLHIKEFKIKEFNNNKIALFMSSMNEYMRVKAYLHKTKTKFFTFTPKNEKTKTYLLKGLSGNTDPKTIYEELCKFQTDNLKFIKVTKFTTKKSVNNGVDLPIFLVQISSESKANELKAINGLLYRCIRWEPLKKPEIPQCRNCQSFFHSASNCFLQTRCVKCKDKHEIGECPVKEVAENEREKLFCVVCNKYGHPASYRGCEKYKELQEKLRAKKQGLYQKRTNNQTYNVKSNMTFANVVKTDNFQNVNNTNPINQALEEFKNSMQNLTNQIINLQKQLQLQAARIDSIFSMLEN